MFLLQFQFGCLPHPPLHCWRDDALRCIGNSLGRYIDRVEPKEKYSCARICVEINLEKGILEAIAITLDNWQHIQQLDYEQLSFKCKVCHEYGHFAKNCKKVPPKQHAEGDSKAQWKMVSKKFGNASKTQPDLASSIRPSATKSAPQTIPADPLSTKEISTKNRYGAIS